MEVFEQLRKHKIWLLKYVLQGIKKSFCLEKNLQQRIRSIFNDKCKNNFHINNIYY